LELYEILVAHVKSPQMVGYQIVYQSKNLRYDFVKRIVMYAEPHRQIEPKTKIIKIFPMDEYIVISQTSYAGKDYFGHEGAYMLHIVLMDRNSVQEVSPLAIIDYLKGPESKPPPEIRVELPILTEPLVVDEFHMKEKTIEIETLSGKIELCSVLSVLLILTVFRETVSISCPSLFDAKALLDFLYRKALEETIVIPTWIILDRTAEVVLTYPEDNKMQKPILKLQLEGYKLRVLEGSERAMKLFLEITDMLSKAKDGELEAIRSAQIVLDVQLAENLISALRIREGSIDRDGVIHALQFLSRAKPEFQDILRSCLAYISANIDAFGDEIISILHGIKNDYDNLRNRIENLMLRLALRNPAVTRRLIEREMKEKNFSFIEKILREITSSPKITANSLDIFVYLSPFDFAKKFILRAVEMMIREGDGTFLEKILLECYPSTITDIIMYLNKSKLCSKAIELLERDDAILNILSQSAIFGLSNCVSGAISKIRKMDPKRKEKILDEIYQKSILEDIAEMEPYGVIMVLAELRDFENIVELTSKLLASTKIQIREKIRIVEKVNTILEKKLRKFDVELRHINNQILRALSNLISNRRQCRDVLIYLSNNYRILKMLELDDRAMEILSTCISYRGIELLNALKSYLSTEPSPDDIEKIFGFRRSPITITKLILEIVERFTKESIDVIPHIHRKLCLWLIDELKSTFKTFRKSKDLGKIKLIERYLKKHFIVLAYLLAVLSAIYDRDLDNECLIQLIHEVRKIGREINKAEDIDVIPKKNFINSLIEIPHILRESLRGHDIAFIPRPCILEVIGEFEIVVSKLYDDFIKRVKSR